MNMMGPTEENWNHTEEIILSENTVNTQNRVKCLNNYGNQPAK